MAQVIAGLLDCVGLPQGESDKRLKKYFQPIVGHQLDDLTVR
jgi:hypothetical protein